MKTAAHRDIEARLEFANEAGARDFQELKSLRKTNAAAIELVEAFKSFLEDDSRSPRRRMVCLRECDEFLMSLRPEVYQEQKETA